MTRLHRWVRQGVVAAGLAATLLVTTVGGASAQADATTASTPSTQVATRETIHTTANHPWLTADRGWVHAGYLRPGERVVTLPGTPGQGGATSNATTAKVAWVRVAPGAAEMDNLTVAQDYAHAAGTGRMLALRSRLHRS